jgi:Retrotransposon gag protein/Zinc knuckle
MADDRPTTSRIFNSLSAAEDAYRQQQQNIDTLITKIDALTDNVNVLTTAINILVSRPSEPPKHTPTPATPDRRQFIGRDRSTEPTIDSNDTDDADDADVNTTAASNYKGLAGVKLPKFHGKYTDDVNAWISIIEDQFYLQQTSKKAKVPAVSALLRDDARTWYIWLKQQYQRPLGWKEFKKELRVKFAESTVRTAALREKLQSISYEGPDTMEDYISRFRSLESQIPIKEMAFGDRLHYFIRPFEVDLKRFIKRDHPQTMELAYDAAIDWAYTNKPPSEKSKNILVEPEKTQNGDLSDDDLDVIDTKQSAEIHCYNCGELGHISRYCKNPKTTRRFKGKAKSFYHSRDASTNALGLMYGDSESESEHTSDDESIDDDIVGVPTKGGGFRLMRKERST